MIKGALQGFMKALNEKLSLSPLYEKRPLVIEIHTEEGPLWFLITNKGHQLLESTPIDPVSLVLSAIDDQKLEQVILGHIPLLSAKDEGHVRVEGPFNLQLTLESLFILSSPHSFLVV